MFEKDLNKILEIRKSIEDIHPLFEKLYPIAVYDQGLLYIYNVEGSRYFLSKVVDAPEWIPEEVLAAFPLQENNGKMTCVVYSGVFGSISELVSVFHEFVHCYQFETCEQELKSQLSISRRYMETGKYDWELTHNFPYENRDFVKTYREFLTSSRASLEEIKRIRRILREILGREDFEYMVWQEWKEGFARYIENLVRVKLGLKEVHTVLKEPYDRTIFYEGGSRIIAVLVRKNPELHYDIKKLFYEIRGL